jgi:hypothetical protein
MRPPLPHRRLRTPALLALVALTLAAAAGCSDDERDPAPATTAGGSGDASAEARIRAVIERSFTTRDPADCAALLTARFLRQVTFERGADALAECRRNAPKSEAARSVAISELSVEGDRASARAVPQGGDSDGQDVTLALVERGGAWKLDRMTALRIERERFDRATRRVLLRGPDASTPQQADCFIRRLSTVSDSALERALVAGDRSVILRATITCTRDVFENTIREELLKGERRITPSQADCVISGLRERIDDAELQQALEESGSQTALPPQLTEELTQLLRECTNDNATVT